MSLQKVYGGTRIGDESRCDSCKYAGIIQGYSESERIVICGRRDEPLRVPFKVKECSDYEDKRLPDYWELKQIAWDVRPKSGDGKTGFVLASELAKQQSQEQTEQEQPAEVPATAAEDE
jgi:hypothetical protein